MSDEPKNAGLARRNVLLGGVAIAAQSALTACGTPGRPPEPLSRLMQGRPRRFVGGVASRIAISPDGAVLAFEGYVTSGTSGRELFVYERDSGICTRLTLKERDQPSGTRCLALMPAFSPSGDHLAVSARRARANPAFRREALPTLLEYADVGVFPWRGDEARRFGDRTYYHSYPVFSPAGDKVAAMRSRNPLRIGHHVESVTSVYNGFVEFSDMSGVGHPFAGLEFGATARFFYETEDSLLVRAWRPLRAGETRDIIGYDRDLPPSATWCIERGTPANSELTPTVPRDFAGPEGDQLCGVDRDGGIWILSRGEIIDRPDSQPIELRLLRAGRVERTLQFAGEMCTPSCVARDRPVFAWITSLLGEDGSPRSAIRVNDGEASELIMMNDVFASLRDRTILT